MRCRSRVGLIFLGVLALTALVLAGVTWRQVRQDRLNQFLIAAVERNDTASVVALLDQGANANYRDEPPRKFTLWQMLMQALHPRPTQPSNALTPLLLALKPQERLDWSVPPENVPLVRALLDHGAQVNQTDELGRTPLWWAVSSGKNATIRLLLTHGANAQATADFLPSAIENDVDVDVIADLIDYGAHLNEPDFSSITALNAAVWDNRVDVVRLLLTRHADVTQMYFGDTPLAEALKTKGLQAAQIVRLLKVAGARK